MASETDKIKKHVDNQVRQLRRDFMEDNGEIKAQVQASIRATEDLRKDFNGRVSKIELSEARREGRESADKGQPLSSNKVIMAIIGLASASIALAFLLAQIIAKGGQ